MGFSHSHSHSHGHSHSHSHDQSSRNIGWAFFLNATFTVIELIGGYLTNSTAIMADAVHDLGDSLSIGMAWILARLSRRSATPTFTYGYHRLSLLGALINAGALLVGSTLVLILAVPRLLNPQMPVVEGMFALAILGVTVNGFAAYKLSHGKTMNERVLNWHMIEDVLGWVAVLIVSIVLWFFEWPILDPILSILFTAFILFNVGKNLYETLKFFLQAAPGNIDYEEIHQQVGSIKGICEVHHMHIWTLDGEKHVLTAHVLLEENVSIDQQLDIKCEIAEKLKPFDISHTTIEVEFPGESCRDGRKHS